MALTIRMRQQGRKNGQVYRLVVTDKRNPRDGKYIEALGWYNPFETELEKNLHIDAARVDFWLKQGAEISERVKSLVLKVAPEVIKTQTARIVQRREKARLKKKS